ncbi:hypothetical protein [Sulfurirhabdus autotrophica]|uniref:Lipoprotein n=1 Tax=Sulfurirhabdus autotrophica TaxID=1706046 RepID=A0A4R3XVB7_9PROT|nr:hypothetical protein [Sulfurirhabdus autotrophica]TCV80114.1 hypothetical protein EDC63_13027 [Sulfurirhabdus autotrophica]
MRTKFTIVFFAQILLLSGCANKETAYANIYEGLKTRNVIMNPVSEQKPSDKSMSYQEYEAERKKLLESNGEK